MPPNRRARLTATIVLVAACLGAFALFKPAPDDDGAQPFVFALSVQDAEGAVLASPVVVGDPAKKMEVRMVCEADPRLERMSLVLEPLASTGDDLAYRYELTVPGQVAKAKGTVHLTQGREKHLIVHPPGTAGVTLALYAAPLKHPGLERYLEQRRRRLGRTAS